GLRAQMAPRCVVGELEYTRYESRPPPCEEPSWITKPIARDPRDTASAPGRRDGQRRRRVGSPIAASPAACVGLWIARPIEWGGAVRSRWTDPARTLAACSGWR